MAQLEGLALAMRQVETTHYRTDGTEVFFRLLPFTLEQKMKISMRNFLSVVSLITCSGLSSAAEDGKYYPGALCQPERNTDPILRDFSGRLLNDSPSDSNERQQWICPIIRDGFDASSIKEAHIVVIDNNAAAGQNVRCRLRSSNTRGTLHDHQLKETLGTGFKLLSYGAPDIAAVTPGIYHFHCLIQRKASDGKRSGIASYRVIENTP